MADKQARASMAPVWIGAIIGTLLGMATGVLQLIVTVPLGMAVGYLVYARRQAALEYMAWQRRADELVERIALLEYSVHRMRSAAPPDAAGAVRAAPVPEPAPGGAEVLDV
ncbi:MAG: hypothetical protein OEV46_06770, partial [Betaproteobacteria bacterium]|nr:hypothetical protein [Betaproteobacteria bacterium]